MFVIFTVKHQFVSSNNSVNILGEHKKRYSLCQNTYLWQHKIPK